MSKLLIADSGATKTDWRLIEFKGETSEVIASFRTAGMNPNVQSMAHIQQQLFDELLPALGNDKNNINEVIFYGAGFSIPAFCQDMAANIREVTKASRVTVEHDLLGAARAAAGNQPGIVCILGTGSNSGLYDGTKLVEYRGGHGYLFGDDGSGADLGKRLMKGLLDKRFPDELRVEFERFATHNVVELKNKIYAAPKPNVYLASFVPFIAKNMHHQQLRELVHRAMLEFVGSTVVQFPRYKNYPLYFVGGVAKEFQAVLKPLCAEIGLSNPYLVGNPIDGLIKYHTGRVEDLGHKANGHKKSEEAVA
jgi:glucosamine kinase